MDSISDRETTIAHIAESEDEIAALRQGVTEIVEGAAFRGSDRCGRFLVYVVEQAIAGRFDSLKERVIGVEIFGRLPSYDTSEDAIVRVTASDVRKRLLQHYGRNGTAAKFHISLPVGSYIPEITCDVRSGAGKSDIESAPLRPVAASASPRSTDRAFEPVSVPIASPISPQVSEPSGVPIIAAKGRIVAIALVATTILLAALNLAQWAVLERASSRVQVAPVLVLPWSALFSSPRATHLILSDVDIVRMQRLMGSRISVSDYANHNYVPHRHELTPEDKLFWLPWMQGDKSAILDTQIAANIAKLAGANSHTIDVEGARNVKFSDLRTDDNFIFLGSPYSDPWFSVFDDQLDFRFAPSGDAGLGPEVIRNVRPRPHEQLIYAPTAKGGATGESYAIVAFVENPNQDGQVLLLAGVSGEGTVAAGKLVTDLSHLPAALQRCELQPSSPLRHFELLLRVNTMAGSPSQFDIVACHILR